MTEAHKLLLKQLAAKLVREWVAEQKQRAA